MTTAPRRRGPAEPDSTHPTTIERVATQIVRLDAVIATLQNARPTRMLEGWYDVVSVDTAYDANRVRLAHLAQAFRIDAEPPRTAREADERRQELAYMLELVRAILTTERDELLRDRAARKTSR
jgi:phosphoribosyl 1,2-cyclic phosphodiesterase